VYNGSNPTSPNFKASNVSSVTQAVLKVGALGTLTPTTWTEGQFYSKNITFTRGGTLANAVTVSTTAPDADTTTTANFVVPALNASTTIQVASTANFLGGETVSISDGIVSIVGYVTAVGANSLTISNRQIVLGAVGKTINANAEASSWNCFQAALPMRTGFESA
jgi:hypothetical protein